MMANRSDIIAAILCCFILIAGCAVLHEQDFQQEVTPPHFRDLMQKMSVADPLKPLTFLQQGPYSVATFQDIKIALRPDRSILTDIYLPAHIEKAPLILIQHGNDSTQKAHSAQARHLASWGFNVVTVGQTKRDHWIENGNNLRDLIALIRKWPALVDESCDLDRIILVGHSFGGSAISLAASNNPIIRGLVLLDPALYSPEVEKALSKIIAPAILLGADQKVFQSKHRATFFNNIPSITEVSLVGTTHDDAQMPSQREINYLFDLSTSERNQRLFRAMLTYSIFELSYAKDPLNLLAKVKIDSLLKSARTKIPAAAPKFSQWSPPDVNLLEPGRE